MEIKHRKISAWVGGFLISTFLLPNSALAAEEGQTSIQDITNAWVLRLPETKVVTFHGSGNLDASGANQGNMLYPAPNPLGLLAAILAHAVIVDSAKRSQLEKMQAQADRVLDPYLQIIEKMDIQEMMKRALAISRHHSGGTLSQPTFDSKNQTVVESNPVFFMVQDQSAIVVDNLLAIQKPGASAESVYRNTIRIIFPGTVDNQAMHWSTNNGEKLVEAIIRALAESFDIALDDANGYWKDENSYRTFRYKEGNLEKIERAQYVDNRCGRTILRNLRGVLISFPVPAATSSGETKDCYQMHVESSN